MMRTRALLVGLFAIAAGCGDETSSPATTTTGPAGGNGGSGAAAGAGGSGATGGAGGATECSAAEPGPSGCWLPMATDGAPAEQRNRGVWANGRLVVWGGMHLNPTLGAFNDGASYDPATDAWAPLPATTIWGRSAHVILWTGQEVIVWAGCNEEYDCQGNWIQGGRYRPDLGTWSMMTVTGVPAGRADASAVWTGDRMLAWGGDNELGPGMLNDGGAYEPSTDSWTALSTTNAPTGRTEHVAAWTGTEMLAWGGFDETSNVNADSVTGGRYDPATDTWNAMAVPAMLTGRRGHTGVWTGTQLLVWGGISGEILKGDGARYDPTTDQWIGMSSEGAPSPRQKHVAVWTGQRMLVWGGTNGAGIPYEPLADGAIYDPATDRWSPMATAGAPGGRSGAIAAWSGDFMIVWGGAGTGDPLTSGAMYFPPL